MALETDPLTEPTPTGGGAPEAAAPPAAELPPDALLQRWPRTVRRLHEAVDQVVIGQPMAVDAVLYALLARGHCLLIGVPGVGKTLLVRTLSRLLGVPFARIQFTPDLMPSDITGTEILEEDHATGHRRFVFAKGPIFTSLLLADEINRTPPKTQAALLEAMQEKTVSIAGKVHRLAEPFLVLATQNPIEQEGTYPLPEAQVDRFMLKLRVTYPDKVGEKEIMRRMASREKPKVDPVLTPDDIKKMRDVADAIYLDEKVEDYIVDVVFATREPGLYKLDRLDKLIEYGASPRATIFLAQAAKVQALMSGRAYVTPQDVKTIGPDVLRHRLLIS
ncbi:MAG TPA: AAA family ATPase, partial [Thermoanaerobaculia bacterium]